LKLSRSKCSRVQELILFGMIAMMDNSKRIGAANKARQQAI
jgi:hypothetical protein